MNQTLSHLVITDKKCNNNYFSFTLGVTTKFERKYNNNWNELKEFIDLNNVELIDNKLFLDKKICLKNCRLKSYNFDVYMLLKSRKTYINWIN